MITGLTYTSGEGNSYVIPHGRIRKIDGLSNSPYRESISKLAGVRGSQYNRSLMDARPINIEWLVMESSMQNYILERQEAFNAFHPDDGEGVLSIEVNSATTYEINCIPNSSPKIPERAGMYPTADAQVQLIANDPVIYSNQDIVSSNVTAPSGGGFTFPATFPITFESTSSGTITLQNLGNIDTYPVITLVDALTNPLIRNATTGEVIQLNYTSSVGDVIEIDMKNRSIILNGVTSLLSDLVEGGEFWTLEPGSNQIILATGSTSDTGYMTVTYRHAWNAV